MEILGDPIKISDSESFDTSGLDLEESSDEDTNIDTLIGIQSGT